MKIIFFDFDGTIANQYGELSNTMLQTLCKLKEDGHFLCACTGRNKNGLHAYIPLFDGYICNAGAYVEAEGEILRNEKIPRFKYEQIKKILDANDALYNIDGVEYTYQTKKFNDAFLKRRKKDLKERDYWNTFYKVRLFDTQDMIDDVQKISFTVEKKKRPLLQTIDLIANIVWFDVDIDAYSHGEITMKGIDKGVGIQRIVDYLGASMEDTIGFGDSMNDFEPLRLCHHGVAMAHAPNALKEIANAVCEDVEDEGVTKELLRLHLL